MFAQPNNPALRNMVTFRQDFLARNQYDWLTDRPVRLVWGSCEPAATADKPKWSAIMSKGNKVRKKEVKKPKQDKKTPKK